MEKTMADCNRDLEKYIYEKRGEGWIETAKALREQLLKISRHPKTKPKDRAQADMYLIYSYKGLHNYRVRVQHFINSVKI